MSMCIFCNEHPKVLGTEACQWCHDAAQAKAAEQAMLDWEMKAIAETEAAYELETILPRYVVCGSCIMHDSCMRVIKGSIDSYDCPDYK